MQRRDVELDVLRGTAILLVLGRHPVPVTRFPFFTHPLAVVWFRFGWTGVDLFFVLSGFLIGGLLFKELQRQGRLDVRRFLIRRAFKIWPPYFALLSWVFVCNVFLGGHSARETLQALLPNLIHVQNYTATLRTHTWSLAVEEHFYLVLPIFLALGGTARMRAVTVAMILCCTWMRHNVVDWRTHFFFTHLRMDSLFFGVWLSYEYHYNERFAPWAARHANALLVAGLLLVSPMLYLSFDHWFVGPYGFVMLYVGYGCMLMAVLRHASRPRWMDLFFASLPARVLAYVGFYSYSIYLWHFDISNYVRNELVAKHLIASYFPTAAAVYVLLCLAAGEIAARLVELPALALRDRFFPSRVGETHSSAEGQSAGVG